VPFVNQILDHVPADTQARLEPHLRLVHLTRGQQLIDAGETSRHIWFPTTSLMSVLGVATTGDVIELATIGPDACTGVWFTLGAAMSSHRVIVRGAGGAYRLPSDVVLREFHSNVVVHRVIAQRACALAHELTQTAVCVAFHALLPRLCRWLLIGRDHTRSGTIDLTQEFIAQMLGVTRPKVSQALLVLEAERVIHQGVGRIHIVNRDGLEALSCECYRQASRQHQPNPPPAPSHS